MLTFNEKKEVFKRKIYSIEIGANNLCNLSIKQVIVIKIKKPNGSYSRDHFAKILSFKTLNNKRFIRLKRLPEYPHKLKNY
ncbi:MAG: hypothetical protein ACFFCC_00890 [Promethearchaeota archaeon]